MKITNCLNRTLMLLAGALFATTISSEGQTVDLTLQNYSSLDLVQVGGSVGGTTMPDAYIGIYTFTTSDAVGVTGLPSTISSICLGPLGELDTGTYKYTLETFSAANPGLNPSSWAYSGTQLWGIQNANYLWSQYGTTANTPTAAAALALAIYDALYNSTGYGATPLTGKGFAPNFASTLEQADYDADIAKLTANSTYISQNLAPGYIFVPTDTSAGGPSGQSFIILDTSAGSAISPVPETATIVAASCLLLPCGIGALRGLRKKQVA